MRMASVWDEEEGCRRCDGGYWSLCGGFYGPGVENVCLGGSVSNRYLAMSYKSTKN